MKKVITHSGSFHSDDVFAVATLQLHFGVENIEVIRTRDEEIINAGDIVVDVGGVYDPDRQRYDHHQNGAPVRDNGIPYAAFGLVWRHYGEEVSGSREVADLIERQLVMSIDATDVGISLFELNNKEVGPSTVQDVLSLWRPVWGSDGDKDKAFLEACALAREILSRAILHGQADIAQRAYAEGVYASTSDKEVLVMDKSVSTHFFIDHPEVKFVIYPREADDKWSAATVRKNHESFESRVSFPMSWSGLRDEELAAASGIPDAVFCHKAGFLFVAKSKEGALEAAKKALQSA